MNITITLPWPSPQLSPNARIHPQARARLVSDARQCARLAMLQQLEGVTPLFSGSLTYEIFAHPPTKARRDLDNIHASLKAYLDGLCDALQIDDARFDTATILRGAVAKPGCVVIDIFDRW